MSEDPRQTALRDALRQVDPEDLRRAAETLQGPLAGLMQALAQAAEAEDPGAEAQRALVDAMGVTENRLPGIELAEAGVQGALLDARLRLEALGAAAASIAGKRDELVAALGSLRRLAEGEDGDAELVALLVAAEALAVQGPDAPEIEALIHELRALIDGIGQGAAAARGEGQAPTDLGARAQTLEARIAAIDQAPRAEDIAALLEQAAAMARQRDSGLALELSQAAAETRERASGLADPRARSAWRGTLDLALERGSLPAAWVAGKRVQAEALAAEDWRMVALVAHRVADLAGDADARGLLARMEEVLALTRLPQHHETARAMLARTVALAQGSEAEARVLLMAGQAWERLGEPAEARRALRRALEQGKDGPAAVIGRAALQLGRLESENAQPHQAGKALELAWRVGGRTGDWALFAQAVPPYVEHLRAQGQADRAREVLVDAMSRAEGAPGGAAFIAEARARWGDSLL